MNHPKHDASGKIEVIEFIEDKGLGFHLGNVVKYVSRAGKKDPSLEKMIEDLKKAEWYLRRFIEISEKGADACRPNEMPKPKTPMHSDKMAVTVKDGVTNAARQGADDLWQKACESAEKTFVELKGDDGKFNRLRILKQALGIKRMAVNEDEILKAIETLGFDIRAVSGKRDSLEMLTINIYYRRLVNELNESDSLNSTPKSNPTLTINDGVPINASWREIATPKTRLEQLFDALGLHDFAIAYLDAQIRAVYGDNTMKSFISMNDDEFFEVKHYAHFVMSMERTEIEKLKKELSK